MRVRVGRSRLGLQFALKNAPQLRVFAPAWVLIVAELAQVALATFLTIWEGEVAYRLCIARSVAVLAALVAALSAVSSRPPSSLTFVIRFAALRWTGGCRE